MAGNLIDFLVGALPVACFLAGYYARGWENTRYRTISRKTTTGAMTPEEEAAFDLAFKTMNDAFNIVGRKRS